MWGAVIQSSSMNTDHSSAFTLPSDLRPRLDEELRELLELAAGHVSELGEVEFADGAVEPGEQIEAGLGDADEDDAAVLVDAVAFGQAAFDEAIDQAGDIGDLCDELLADGLAGDTVAAGGGECGGAVVLAVADGARAVGVIGVAAEDAEGVVGGFAQAVGAEEPLKVPGEAAGGAKDVEVGLLLGEVEGQSLADLVLKGVRRDGGLAGHD